MLRGWLVVSLLLAGGAPPGHADAAYTAAHPHAPAASLEYPVVENGAWRRGERLTFSVKFGQIRAGTAEMTVEDEISWGTRTVQRIRFTVRSVWWFFYRVRDTIVSYLDREGLFTYRYEKHQREGNYRNDEVTTFHHEASRAERIKNGEREPPFETPPFVVDVLGSLYRLRTMDFDVGDVVRLPVSDGRRSYEMEVHVLARERVEVPTGEFTTLKVEPKLQSEGIFLKKGRLFVWLTDDHRKIPVRVRTQIPVGWITAHLEEMRGVLPDTSPVRTSAGEGGV